MRDGGIIGNARHVDSFARKTAECGFATGANPTDDDVDLFDSDDGCFVTDELTDFGRRERCPLLRAGKAECARRRPGDRVAVLVGEKNLCVVVGRVDMERPCEDVLLGNASERARLEPLVNRTT